MRAWRRANNEASPEEIQKEGMRSWNTEYSEKTPEQLKAATETERKRLGGDTKPLSSGSAGIGLGAAVGGFGAAAAAAVISLTEPSEENFGDRIDGTKKGLGFQGKLKRSDGGFSTELSIGVRLEANNRNETQIPTILPSTKGKELEYLLDTPINQLTSKDPELWDTIVQKAVDHANKRVRAGKSPFKGGVLKKPPVKMQSPDGRTGTIPADQVEKAISLGWKKL